MKATTLYVLVSCAIALNCVTPESSIENEKKECHYRDTVDLTKHPRLENGSYLYYDTLIPKHKVQQFDYNLAVHGEMNMVATHPRGCVCDADQTRFCVKLCCELGEMFNYLTHRCEKLPDAAKMPTNVTIRLQNGSFKEVNILKHFVVQIGIPCAKPQLQLGRAGTWSLLEDGTLNITNMFTQHNTSNYCYTPYRTKVDKGLELRPMRCPNAIYTIILTIVYGYGLPISAIFFTVTAIIYLSLKELRASLRGKILICYLISMATGYVAAISGEYHKTMLTSTVCKTGGYIGQFSLVAGFLWLGVLSHDICESFTNTLMTVNREWQRKRFLIYSLCVWGTAGIQLAVVVWAEISSLIPEIYKPGIGIEKCWLNTKRWSAAIYFYVPMSVVVLFYIITFIRVSIWIYQGRHNQLIELPATQKYLYQSAAFTLRVFVIMGITWITEVMSFFVRHFQVARIIFTICIFFDVIQGFVIFTLLVCRRNMFVILKGRVDAIRRRNVKHVPSFSNKETDETNVSYYQANTSYEIPRQMEDQKMSDL